MMDRRIVNKIIAAMIVSLFFSGSARAELDHVSWWWTMGFDRKSICSGVNPPTSVGVTLFTFESIVYGFMKFGWYENNRALRDDQYIVLDVNSPGAGKIFGSSISIPSLKFNEGVTGAINGVTGTTLDVAVEGQGWACREPLLKWDTGHGWGSGEAKYRFNFISDARNQGALAEPCADERILAGPTEREISEMLEAAVALRLCNPRDLETLSNLQMLRATGIGDYRAIGRSCRAFLLGAPIMDIAVSRKTSTCKVGSTGTADCIANFELLCETPDVRASGIYCLDLVLANVDAKANFKFDNESCKWEVENLSLRN